jgi:calmodulin
MELMSKVILDGREKKHEELHETFRSINKSDSGFISKDEFIEFMKVYADKTSDEDLDMMFEDSDNDADGNLNYTDFVYLLMAK